MGSAAAASRDGELARAVGRRRRASVRNRPELTAAEEHLRRAEIITRKPFCVSGHALRRDGSYDDGFGKNTTVKHHSEHVCKRAVLAR